MQNNVGLILAKRAHLNPDREALVDLGTDRRFTFRELNSRSNRVAHALADLGIAKGDRVALLLMNSTEFVEAFYAIAKVGAVVVPLNWRLTANELSFILADAGAVALIFGEEFDANVADLHARGDEGTDIRHWVRVGAPAAAPSFARPYDDWVAGRPDEEPAVGAAGDDLLYIMYTSGTTGLPKGAMHSHATQLWAVLTIAATADFRHKDRYLNPMPMFHVGSLTPAVTCFYSGVTMVLMRAFDPVKAWEAIRDERIDNGLMVPAMLNVMAQVHDPVAHTHPTLRWILTGAAPVPVSIIEAYAALGIEIQQVYGLTETCGPACLITSDDALARAGSTGKAFFHTDVKIVRRDGTDAGPDEPGEVLVRGPHITPGYWNRPDATVEAIRAGWLHTGDIAVMDADGFVTIQDRLKDMIISGGENVYPAEVENVIIAHPKVRDVAVIGQRSPRWGESPLALVVRADESLTAADVLAWCADKLARFKQPKAVEFVTEVPRNPSGKILKRVLRDQFPGDAAE